MFGRIVKRLAKKGPAPRTCRCRSPKTHRDCLYCGVTSFGGVCGVCKEAGIDGPTIRGTGRVICSAHKSKS